MIAAKTNSAVKVKRVLALVFFIVFCLTALPYVGMQSSNLLSGLLLPVMSNPSVAVLLSVFVPICLITIIIGCIEIILFRFYKLIFVFGAILPTILFFTVSQVWALVYKQEWSFLLQYVLVFASAVYLGCVSITLFKFHKTK